MTNCNDGIVIYDNSFPDMYDPPYYDGYNSIHDNTIDISLNYVSIATSSNLDALGDYWNGGNPANAHFQTAADSKIYTDMYLTTDPWAGVHLPSMKGGSKTTDRMVTYAAPAGAANEEGPMNASISSSSVEPKDSLLKGIQYRAKGEFKKAVQFFQSWLSNHPGDQRAYVELYDCANNTTIPDLIQYFKNLPEQASKRQSLLLGYLYLKDRKVSNAKEINNKLIQANPKSAMAQVARINNGYFALYNDNNMNKACNIYTTILNNSGSVDTMELNMFRVDITNYARNHQKSLSGFPSLQKSVSNNKTDNLNTNKPTVTTLDANYPNPFNPTTNIKYELAHKGHVQLTIWNVLGQKVATLVNAREQKGIHLVTFNALHFSSGLYFYRLQEGNKILVKKMLLLK